MEGSELNPVAIRSSSASSRVGKRKSRRSPRSPTVIPQEYLDEERERQLSRIRRPGDLNIDSSEEETRAEEAQKERPIARRVKPAQTTSYIPSRFSQLHHMGSMLREEELPRPKKAKKRSKRRMTAESAPLDFLPSNRTRRAINERPPSPLAEPPPMYLPRIHVKHKGVLGVERVTPEHYFAVDSHGKRVRVPFKRAKVLVDIPYQPEVLPSPSRERMVPKSRETWSKSNFTTLL